MADFNIDDLLKQQQINTTQTATQPAVSPTKSAEVIPLVEKQEGEEKSNNSLISEEKKVEIEQQAGEIRKERGENNAREIAQITQTKKQAQQEQGVGRKYMEVLFSSKKPSEKALEVANIYLSAQDEKYQALKTEQEKKDYIQKIMTELDQHLNNGNSKTNPLDILTLITIADKNNWSPETIISKSNTELKDKIIETQKNEIGKILNKITPDNPQKGMQELAEKILILTGDKEISEIKDPKEKGKYINTKIDNFLREKLGISGWKDSTDNGKAALIMITKIFIEQVVEQKGISGITDFKKLSEKEKALFIQEGINKIINDPNLGEEYKKILKAILPNIATSIDIVNKINKEKPTNQDMLNYLEAQHNKGKLSKEEAELYKYYKNIKELGQLDMNAEAQFIGNIIEARLLHNGNMLKHLQASIGDKNIFTKEGKSEIQKWIDKGVADGDPNQINILKEFLISNHNMTKEEAEKYIKQFNWNRSLSAAESMAYARGDAEAAAITAKNIDDFGHDQLKEASINFTKKHGAEQLGEEGSKQYFKMAPDSHVGAMSYSVNHTFDIETARNIFTDVAGDKNVPADRRGRVVQESLLTTDDPNRIRAYTNSYKKIPDSTVTEAMAAAAHDTQDSNIREIIESGVNYAIQNNGYSTDEKNRINTALETGNTSYLSTSNSSSSSSSSGTGKSSSSQGTSGSRGTSSSHGTSGSNGTSGSSNTPKTGSSSNSSSAQSAAAQARAQAQQDYAQAVTQALQLRKEEALKRLAQITENYQKSVKEREERKAKEAQKTQKTEEQSTNKDYSKFDPEVRKVLEESDRVFESADKTLEIAKIDSALTDAEIAVPADKREELIQAYQSGGAAYLYEKLGSVSTKYQEQYLHYFAEHASTSDLCSFAEKHVGNKNIILALYQRSNNPALLQYLGESNALDLLNKGKIKLEDFLKYASPDTVARYIQSMKEIGNTDAIKAVVSQLSLKQREETSESVIAEAQNNTPLPGSDEWIRAQQKQMENASNLGVEPKASAPKRETEKLNLDGSTPTIGAGMLSLNPEEDEFDGLSMGSNRVRMGIDIKKRDKRFFRIG